MAVWLSCIENLKEKYGKKNWFCLALVLTKLLLHFLVVMTFLGAAAICFTRLEDPPTSYDENNIEMVSQEEFIGEMKSKYSMNMSMQTGILFLTDIEKYLDEVKVNRSRSEKLRLRADRRYIYKKWFYFTNIAATTIGKL